jgi:hypothetical protein
MRILGDGQTPAAMTVQEFRRSVPMADAPEFDVGLQAVIAAATTTVEAGANRPLVVRPVEFIAPASSGQCWTRWWFPCAPVAEVTEVAVMTSAAWTVLDPADWLLEFGHDEPQLVLADSVRTDHGAVPVRVRANVGYAAGRLPAPLLQAVILTAQEWHMAAAGLGDAVTEVRSFTAHALIRQNRYSRPKVCA